MGWNVPPIFRILVRVHPGKEKKHRICCGKAWCTTTSSGGSAAPKKGVEDSISIWEVERSEWWCRVQNWKLHKKKTRKHPSQEKYFEVQQYVLDVPYRTRHIFYTVMIVDFLGSKRLQSIDVLVMTTGAQEILGWSISYISYLGGITIINWNRERESGSSGMEGFKSFLRILFSFSSPDFVLFPFEFKKQSREMQCMDESSRDLLAWQELTVDFFIYHICRTMQRSWKIVFHQSPSPSQWRNWYFIYIW